MNNKKMEQRRAGFSILACAIRMAQKSDNKIWSLHSAVISLSSNLGA